MVDLQDVKIDDDFISRVIKNVSYNRLIIDYYTRLYHETGRAVLGNKVENIKNCNKFWLIDKYEKQKIKDYKKTSLCHDKFCNNCKKVKQASRMARFIPYIKDYQLKGYYLFHMVLTVPSVLGGELGGELSGTIKTMNKAFRRLIRYLSGDLMLSGVDIYKWGYMGSIRSLEVTYSNYPTVTYHPHFHVVICFDRFFLGVKHVKNKYSYDYVGNRGLRLFSDEEILIQKIWYLLINGVRVTQKNIDDLDLGYSCIIDPLQDGHYLEIFKYITKFDDGFMTYDNFKTLYYALYRVRQIQGYGCFYNIKEDDSIIDEVDELYDWIVQYLQKKEHPLEVVETPKDVFDSVTSDCFTVISRHKIYSYLRSIENDLE